MKSGANLEKGARSHACDRAMLPPVLHLALHLLVPLVLAGAVYRPHWVRAFALLMATMAVDADHLLADPIYDPNRCSIDFHPLHGTPAIAIYALAMLLPLGLRVRSEARARLGPWWTLHLLGTGLIVHMVLDAGDCWL